MINDSLVLIDKEDMNAILYQKLWVYQEIYPKIIEMICKFYVWQVKADEYMNHLLWNLINLIRDRVFSIKTSNIKLQSNISKISPQIDSGDMGWYFLKQLISPFFLDRYSICFFPLRGKTAFFEQDLLMISIGWNVDLPHIC